ncbi:tetratricopeptide repeat protein [Croceicoccus gelatinilyticus]|uniref:tetratricopeptide repeat protein n=1 Tax=Croceicoccus gelatinilyticus TaxID=2835536 RepID=UPI001CECFF38|nr:tetratricopeptide repeat protein [Croceicoccus gelatinilyticus]
MTLSPRPATNTKYEKVFKIMTSIRRRTGRFTGLLMGTVLSAALLSPMPASAQDESTRIRKLESEVRALQRKVFPGGDGKYFEPEITAAQPSQPAMTTGPASGPVTDLLARMDAVESALASLTAQVEVQSNAMRLMNSRLDEIERKTATSMPMPVEPNGGIGDGAGPLPATPAPRPATVTPTPTPAPAPSGASTVERPNTGDAGDDAYVYGYRLWNEGYYAPARTALQQMLNDYPTHSRASYARNLLGRAYLDDGQARPAAEAFLKNYLDNRGGARAPDSLVYLAIATLQLGNKAKACEALEEFRLVYPQEASGRLSSLSSETATKAGCS